MKDPQKKTLEESAKKTNDIGQNKLNVSQEKSEYYNKLWKASAVEIIPFLNIIAAIYSRTVLNKLSDLREVNTNEDSKNKFLLSKYKLENYYFPEKKKFIEALTILNELKVKKPIENDIKMSIATAMRISSMGEPQRIIRNAITWSIDDTITKIKKLNPNFVDNITESLKEKSIEECWQTRVELQKEFTQLRQEKIKNKDFSYLPLPPII